jgi:gentisate 1,2-dioxygenase
VLAGSGVWTLVNGDPIYMAPGDLVLTPSWTWHEHHNPGAEPMIWFDGLDLPLVRNLDAMFFEPGSEKLTGYQPVTVSRSENRYGSAGLLPTADEPAIVRDPASGRFSRLLDLTAQVAADDTIASPTSGHTRGPVPPPSAAR